MPIKENSGLVHLRLPLIRNHQPGLDQETEFRMPLFLALKHFELSVILFIDKIHIFMEIIDFPEENNEQYWSMIRQNEKTMIKLILEFYE